MPGTTDNKTPLSPAQLAARRANSQKSTGPKDTSMTRFNGTKHGMRAETPVLPGEDQDRYDRRLAALVARHDPQEEASRFEVEWAAKVAWKMERGEAVEVARATKAINDACRGDDEGEADDAEFLGSELAANPAGMLRMLRKTSAGCTFCLEQYEALLAHLATYAGLLGTQRHRALHLAGKRMTDVLADDPLALCWFLALIGASYGNQGETLDIIAKCLGNGPPEGMGTPEFQVRVKDLAAQVPSQAEGRARLLAYLAEAVAALREHLAFVREIEEEDRSLAVQSARIDLGAEGKQLLRYQATQERSYQAALRRLDAVQNSGRAGPGRPPKRGAPPVAVPATQAPATTDRETPAGRRDRGHRSRGGGRNYGRTGDRDRTDGRNAGGQYYDRSEDGPGGHDRGAGRRYYDRSEDQPRGGHDRGTRRRYYDRSEDGPRGHDRGAGGQYYDRSEGEPDGHDRGAGRRFYDRSEDGPRGRDRGRAAARYDRGRTPVIYRPGRIRPRRLRRGVPQAPRGPSHGGGGLWGS